ncbi:MAG: hypothetical protein CMK92_05475 [Pseudomonas sp.]|nr:hypothetical protein [Pseudomonas sp.]
MIMKSLRADTAKIKECSICLTKVHYKADTCPGCQSYLATGATKKTIRKEIAIKYILEENKIDFIHDKIVDGGCSRHRPDFVISTSWGVIILEIDEFQHKRKNYSCSCEITRMKKLFHDQGVSHLLFIRYNPDTYKVCLGTKKFTTIDRQNYLIRYINEQIDKFADFAPDFNLACSYLFFDGFTPTQPPMDVMDPYAIDSAVVASEVKSFLSKKYKNAIMPPSDAPSGLQEYISGIILEDKIIYCLHDDPPPAEEIPPEYKCLFVPKSEQSSMDDLRSFLATFDN